LGNHHQNVDAEDDVANFWFVAPSSALKSWRSGRRSNIVQFACSRSERTSRTKRTNNRARNPRPVAVW